MVGSVREVTECVDGGTGEWVTAGRVDKWLRDEQRDGGVDR